MVELVERMLDLHKQLPKVEAPHEQAPIRRTIEANDKQIDVLVHELYGLTREEIRTAKGELRWSTRKHGKHPRASGSARP
ncbi:hypothetical protein FJY68_10605 [candidate division WOR-3 bacterium]|uniref:Uncharacterized protein n=1 Tax=candidate division WOR-3 bacterium TaxID=2052148 RepID=A0A938BQL1_UNCW3|nr:hypothetical protein [candidate division WOR-3 bacterium]